MGTENPESGSTAPDSSSPEPRDRARRRIRRGKILVVVGLVLAVLGVPLYLYSESLLDDQTASFRNGLVIQPGIETTGDLQPGSEVTLWAIDDTEGGCTVANANGAAADIDSEVTVTRTHRYADALFTWHADVRATEAGEHTITCTGDFLMTEKIPTTQAVQHAVSNLGSVVLFYGGLAAAVVGAILWLTGRSTLRRADGENAGPAVTA